MVSVPEKEIRELHEAARAFLALHEWERNEIGTDAEVRLVLAMDDFELSQLRLKNAAP